MLKSNGVFFNLDLIPQWKYVKKCINNHTLDFQKLNSTPFISLRKTLETYNKGSNHDGATLCNEVKRLVNIKLKPNFSGWRQSDLTLKSKWSN